MNKRTMNYWTIELYKIKSSVKADRVGERDGRAGAQLS